MIYETQEQLNAALAYWQKVLRLQDWIIIAKIERMANMGNKAGWCHWKTETKKAVIELLDPIDVIDWDFPLDHEHTLVHELLHLHFELVHFHNDFKEGTIGDVAMEQSIDCITTGIVSLKGVPG